MRENRVPIMLTDEELKAIDDWRFNHRVATRSGAIRHLCKTGLVLAEHNAAEKQAWLATPRTETDMPLIVQMQQAYHDAVMKHYWESAARAGGRLEGADAGENMLEGMAAVLRVVRAN